MKTLTYSIERRDPRGETRLVGGFADRLKGITFSWAVAALTQRHFHIDWSRPCALDTLMPPISSDWRLTDTLATRLRHAVRFDWVDAGFTKEVAHRISGPWEYLDASLFGGIDDVVLHANSIQFDALKPHLERLRTMGIECSSAMDLFALAFENLFSSDRINASMAWTQWNFFRSNVPAIVAGQFRTGVSSVWKDPALDNVDNSEAFAAALVRHARRKGLKEFGIFFTSDNEEALRRIGAALPPDIPKFHYPGERFHMERSPEESAYAGAMQVAVEHTVLSSCDHIVIGAGQFGLTAAFRGRKMPVHYLRVS